MGEISLAFAERIRNGELLLGTIIGIHSAENTEILALSGVDWLFIDAEHGPFDPHDTQMLLQAAGQCPCLIRVPGHDEVWLKKALDIGAAGIIVPQVKTAEQARQIVDLCKYPPRGTRGMGVGRASKYGSNLTEYVEKANTTTAIVLQAEHRDAVENIDDIVKVEGIDAILVGPFDLSASYGKPGKVSAPEVLSAIDTITHACAGAGVTLATAVATAGDARPYLDRGFKLIAAGIDALYLSNSAKQTLVDLRN